MNWAGEGSGLKGYGSQPKNVESSVQSMNNGWFELIQGEGGEKSEVDSANIFFFTENGGEPEMDVDPITGALGQLGRNSNIFAVERENW